MKIGIITVYNSVNSGSYWQANALQKFMANRNNEVYFLKRPEKGSSASFCKKTGRIIKRLVKFQYKEALVFFKTFKEFKKANKSFKVININDSIVKELDLIIIGSDTIWNFDSSYFEKNYEFFFAKHFNDKPIITYAGSAANTSVDKFLKNGEIKKLISKWNKISVRDKHSQAVFEKLTDKKIELVCDPTFLIDKIDYEKYVVKPMDKDYIFLYLFENLSENQKIQLKDFAKLNNLKIISGTNSCTFCDKTIINSPYNFLNYMFYADYVITDTFHGTIFSVNLQKQFAVIDRQKIKVNELLDRLELKDRLIEDKNIKEVLDNELDYSNKSEINKFKTSSRIFLENCLENR